MLLRSPTAAYVLIAACLLGVFASFMMIMQAWILPKSESRAQRQAVLPQSAADLPLPNAEDRLATDSVPLAANDRAASRNQDAFATDSPRDMIPARLESNETTIAQPDPSPAEPRGSSTDASEPIVSVIPSPAERLIEADVNQQLLEAFQATVAQRWSDAERSLAQAKKLAETSPIASRVERFSALNDYAHQYWQAFEAGLEGLPGSELVVGQQRMMVVEVNDDDLVFRIAGVNRPYPRRQLPTLIVMAIADRWFDQRSASTQVFRGAFMAVNDEFTAQDVRQAWREAQRGGADLGDLLLLLDDLAIMGIPLRS